MLMLCLMDLKHTVTVDEKITRQKLLNGWISGKDVFYFFGHASINGGVLAFPGIIDLATGKVFGDVDGLAAMEATTILSQAISDAGPEKPDCKVVFLVSCASLLTGQDAVRDDSIKFDYRGDFSPGAEALANAFGEDCAVFGFGNVVTIQEGHDMMRDFLAIAKKTPVARVDSIWANWVASVAADEDEEDPRYLLKLRASAAAAATDLNNAAP